MLDLLRTDYSSSVVTLDRICSDVSETRAYVEHTLKELEDDGIIKTTIDGESINIVLLTQNTTSGASELVYRNTQERICAMFRDNRVYSIIAWFLDELGVEYSTDIGLRERVLAEYDDAKVVQFWTDDEIFTAMRTALSSGRDKDTIRLADLRAILSKKDSGI